MMVALAVSVKGRVASISAIVALVTMVISLMTGERINFLIRACGGMLAGLVWKPKWGRYLALVAFEILAVILIFSALPETATRYTNQFIKGATDVENSPYIRIINGGFQLAQDNLMFGIGTANYRMVSYGALDNYENVRPDVHPHNYYVQILLETGLIGFVLGIIFLGSIIWSCFRASFVNRNNVFVATAWVIPFGIFLAHSNKSGFFGQWNNVFIWSAVSLALSSMNVATEKR